MSVFAFKLIKQAWLQSIQKMATIFRSQQSEGTLAKFTEFFLRKKLNWMKISVEIAVHVFFSLAHS